LTAIAAFTPKEGSQILIVDGRLSQLLGSENAAAFEDTVEMENKKRPGEGCSDWSSTLSMYVSSGYPCSTYSYGPSSSVSSKRSSSSVTIVDLFDVSLLNFCCFVGL
jgi:hypothetical protein